ncbi:MAG: zinc ribbon domain-containing protein [Gaiellaceae bacterium MAG52_C11]|nr:zinc ribbon domain-containing protein [Candidatus Gaiellasilicea maunaloa]
MPIYEYRCPDGHTFEVFQRMADPPSEVCEVCGKAPVEKVLYPVAVHYKGSGFYSTDYGKGGRKAAAKDGDSGSSSSNDSGSGGKDSAASGDSGSTSSSSESASKPAAAAD